VSASLTCTERAEDSSSGLSEGDVAGIVIAWLLGLPLFMCGAAFLVMMYRGGAFDDAIDKMW
jgi:hypothetical protein